MSVPETIRKNLFDSTLDWVVFSYNDEGWGEEISFERNTDDSAQDQVDFSKYMVGTAPHGLNVGVLCRRGLINCSLPQGKVNINGEEKDFARLDVKLDTNGNFPPSGSEDESWITQSSFGITIWNSLPVIIFEAKIHDEWREDKTGMIISASSDPLRIIEDIVQGPMLSAQELVDICSPLIRRAASSDDTPGGLLPGPN